MGRIKIFGLVAFLLAALAVGWWALGRRTGPPPGGFAGSGTCRGCHERFYQLWSASHHGLAMQPFSAELARREFTEQEEGIPVRESRYRAEIGAGLVREDGPGGGKAYPIAHVMGGKNVYYLLTPFARGRLQVLPVAYDVRRKAWYDTSASAMRHFGDIAEQRVHWTDPELTFNTSCHGCHVSQLVSNFDLDADAYRTTWAEPGINCETCHGPSGEHVRVCREVPPGQAPTDLKIIRTKQFTHEQMNDLCAPCHAKMSPIAPSFRPGDRYFDHFDLSALENRDFYPDGRDLGENYTFTLWRSSPCVASGALDCMHCHTSSGRYRFKDPEKANDACRPCHEERVRDVLAHSRHPAGKPGTRCVECHMPTTEFARMARSDHSMRPPAPAATLAFRSPNACTLCHADEGAAWADRQVRAWHPEDYQAPGLERARLIEAARKGDWSRLPAMLASLRGRGRDEVHAASLIRLLRSCPADGKGPALLEAASDPSPWVRAAAAEALGDRLTPEVVAALAKAARDAFRLVRVRAAYALASVAPDLLPVADRKDVEAAAHELEASLTCRPDDYASHYNLGNLFMSRRDPARAVAAFETSIRLRPDVIPPRINASLAYNLLGRNREAEESLRQVLARDPNSLPANLNLGMLLGELGRLPEAEAAFRAALKADPMSAPAAYNLGVLVARDRLEEAVPLCRRAAELQPDEPKYAYTLAFYQRKQGDAAGATAALERLLRGKTASVDAYLLLGELYERQGRGAEAQALYRRGAEDTRLPAADRARLVQGLQR